MKKLLGLKNKRKHRDNNIISIPSPIAPIPSSIPSSTSSSSSSIFSISCIPPSIPASKSLSSLSVPSTNPFFVNVSSSSEMIKVIDKLNYFNNNYRSYGYDNYLFNQ